MSTSTASSAPGQNDRLKAKITKAIQQLDLAVASLDEHHQQVVLLQKQLKALVKSHEKTQNRFIKQVSSIAEGIGAGSNGSAAGGGSQDQLLNATKKMQETQMSFNLQYLQLQSQMQQENRSYTAISSIMKTKHDTVKNSVSNIR